jgi:hypothetical protein
MDLMNAMTAKIYFVLNVAVLNVMNAKNKFSATNVPKKIQCINVMTVETNIAENVKRKISLSAMIAITCFVVMTIIVW